MRQQDVVKELSVAKTKGAPKRRRETGSSTHIELGGKRRCCTSCGLPGHTKRTCLSERDRSQVGIREGLSATVENSSSREPGGYHTGTSSSKVKFSELAMHGDMD
ncbi:hypothetical protein AHAS_Ahas02G0075800 [Arachis hypogaea]